MALSALVLAQDVADELGLRRPASLAGADALSRQFRAIMETTAQDMLRRHNWQALKTEASFTTVADDETQVSNIKSSWPDFQRFIPDTFYNRTENRAVFGGVSAQAWQAAQSRIVSTADYYFRVRGDKILLYGNRPAGHSVFFEYVSNYLWSSADGADFYQRLNADTNTSRLPEYGLMLGLKWRLLRANGLEYAEAFRDYENFVAEARANDEPRERISLTPATPSLPGSGFVPEGSFPAS